MSLTPYEEAKKAIGDYLASVEGRRCDEINTIIHEFMEEHGQEIKEYMRLNLYLVKFLDLKSPCVLNDDLGATWVSFAHEHQLNYPDAFLRQVYLIECGIPVQIPRDDKLGVPGTWAFVFSVGVVLSGIIAMWFR